jgi:hypothetical protein
MNIMVHQTPCKALARVNYQTSNTRPQSIPKYCTPLLQTTLTTGWDINPLTLSTALPKQPGVCPILTGLSAASPKHSYQTVT